MTEQISYVIVGNGIAGVTAAEILRSEDSAAKITVVADSPYPVYYRPALKDFLGGRMPEERLWARPKTFYQDYQLRFVPDRVVGIHPQQHLVQLASRRQLGYNRLLLAQGARAAALNCPGINLSGVATLRTVGDYQNILRELPNVRRIVACGSGTLALESVETLRHQGYQVTHLMRRNILWSEVLDETASDLVLQQEHRDNVDLRLGEEIAEIAGSQGRVTGVITTSGTHIPCELVLIAIGIEPEISFLRNSSIIGKRGIKVDQTMKTNTPDIYAAGDVLETTDPHTARTRVLGQWYPAIQQARVAAYSMLELLDTTTLFQSQSFYNASFLYGLEFASVGLTTLPHNTRGYQELVAEPQPRIYRKVLLKEGVPVGILFLGDRKDARAFKRAIDHRVNLSSASLRLFQPAFKLNEWLDQQGVPPAILGANRAGDTAIRRAVYAMPTGTNHPNIAIATAPTVVPDKPAPLVRLQNSQSGNTAIRPAQPLKEAYFVPVPLPETTLLLHETLLSQTRTMTIGRQAGVYLLIDHASISRRHAEVSYANGQYVLHDLDSTNGTFVNETRLEPGSTYILQEGDLVRFGKLVKFTFQLRTIGSQNG